MNNRLRLERTASDSDTRRQTRFVSILSGKGGVGKTVIACNLAERIASRGCRVLLVDADFDLGNVHLLTNTVVDYGVGALAAGQLSLKEAVTGIFPRLDMLASESNQLTSALLDAAAARALMTVLRQQAQDYDLVVLDHSSGKSTAATAISLASELSLIVTVPELTALADGYGLLKHLTQSKTRSHGTMIVNRTTSPGEATYVREKLTAMAERFLNCPLSWLGALPEDPAVRDSISRQQLLCRVAAGSAMLTALDELALRLIQQLDLQRDTRSNRSEIQINESKVTADIKE